MTKIKWLVLGAMFILMTAGWFGYQKMTDDTYQGMSIIPEKHEDIPLFKGLEPTEHQYVLAGNRWRDLEEFYLKELPKLGWNLEDEGATLNDHDAENNGGGFHSRWRKEGFDGELWISAHFNQVEEQTEVIFDKTPLHPSTTWINHIPESICVYQSVKDDRCSEIKDEVTIKHMIGFINEAIDWNEEDVLPRNKTSVIRFGDTNITVHYGNKEEIYFQSDKGTKWMKPEPAFFEYTNLTQ